MSARRRMVVSFVSACAAMVLVAGCSSSGGSTESTGEQMVGTWAGTNAGYEGDT